jgi:ribosome-associated protein
MPGEMIEINDRVTIDESELQLDFIRSSGPGGQNVNKVSSGVQLRYDVKNSPSLPEDIRIRLMHQAHNRITQDGILILEAKQYRTQEQNRQAAIERLVELIRQVSKKPKIRKRTKPSRESNRKRLEAKRHRGQIKRLRRPNSPYDEG